MEYLLDTDTISNLVKPRPSPSLKVKLEQVSSESLGISMITLMELYMGQLLSSQPELIRRFIEDWILQTVTVFEFDQNQAKQAAAIQRRLRQEGQTLDWLDVMIAACAIAKGRILVTGNIRHFRRIPHLRVENWLV